MQAPKSFHLLFRWMSLDDETSPSDASKSVQLVEKIAAAARHLDDEQQLELREFLDTLLAGDADSKQLVEVFKSESFYFVWRTDDGPRRYLTLIREALAAAGPARSTASTSSMARRSRR